jgi:Leucine-rich repeat (LRR) protein
MINNNLMSRNLAGLDMFINLKILNLEKNNLTSLDTFPRLERLETLNLSYNPIKDEELFLVQLEYNVRLLFICFGKQWLNYGSRVVSLC